MHRVSKALLLIICSVLCILPFIWLHPSELELGGDSNRLFLYNPGAYLRAESLFSVEPDGIGHVRPDQALIPFLLLLQLIYTVSHSPYLLMSLLNSIKMVGSFYFVYLVIVELLKPHGTKRDAFISDIAGMVAGLWYAFSPSVGSNMHVALLTHNQVFLNPLMFYLLLRFFVTQRDFYLWILLGVTFLFSPNFSLIAPPPPFAFYPLSLAFIGLYTVLVARTAIPWKKLGIGLCLFLGLHAFHILPIISYVFDPSSYFHTRVFDSAVGQNDALNYFNAVLGLGKVSKNIFYSYADPAIRWTTIVAPLMIVAGFLVGKKIKKDLLLISVFYLVTLFLISANITTVGLNFYRRLFDIPGFGMFRVFYGQWQWVYAFFYSLLLGYMIRVVFSKLRMRYIVLCSCVLLFVITYSSWEFVSGSIFRTPHRGSNNVTSVIRLNPDYERTLAFIRTIPNDGKFINFPFTDYIYQVVPGMNNGAYIGVSPTAYLLGRRDFSGYPGLYPFPDQFLQLIKEKNYSAIQQLFGILNIRYIFYDTDPKAYTQSFPEFPYSLIRALVPDAKSLEELVGNLASKKVFEAGVYRIYEIDTQKYLPHFYVPLTVHTYIPVEKNESEKASISLSAGESHTDPRLAYITSQVCMNALRSIKSCAETVSFGDQIPAISYKRINPVKYRVHIAGSVSPYILIFSDAYNRDWNAYVLPASGPPDTVVEKYFHGDISESAHKNIFYDANTFETMHVKSLPQTQHFMANGYANAWYIGPEDGLGKDYDLIIEMKQQRYFYYGLGISVISVGIFLIIGLMIFVKSLLTHR